MPVKTSRLRATDSHKFENMYSNKDGIRYSDIKISDIPFEEIEPYLSQLPPREIDLLTLHKKYGKNQKDIAKMFSVTQGAVSSRLKRAISRLQFIRDMPKVSDEDIERVLSPVFEELEIEIIKFMKRTTCQSRTADLINQKFKLVDEKSRMTQVKVRHRFIKAKNMLKKLHEKNTDYARIYNLMEVIDKNLYKLHEVILPHFDRGRYAVFSLKT